MNQDQIKELRRLAEAASGNNCTFQAINSFKAKVNPSDILSLLDHIATLEKESAANLQRALVAEKELALLPKPLIPMSTDLLLSRIVDTSTQEVG